MIKTIFVVLGLVMFADALFEKWKIWDRLARWATNGTSKFFFMMLMCRFCMMFHLSWIVTVVYIIINGFSWGVAVVPFVVSGLIQLNERK